MLMVGRDGSIVMYVKVNKNSGAKEVVSDEEVTEAINFLLPEPEEKKKKLENGGIISLPFHFVMKI